MVGCGYSTKRPFPTNIRTLHVEMFHSKEFRRELEFRLTEALVKRIEMDMLSIKAKHDAIGRYKTGIGMYRTSSDQQGRADGVARGEIFSHKQVETRPPIALDAGSHVRRARRADADDVGASIEMDGFLNIKCQGDARRGRKVFECQLDGATKRGNIGGKR